MKGYVIGEVEVRDPAAYENYRKQVLATIEKFGGRFLVRGGATQTLEGDWTPGRIVVLEFPSVEKAKEWWASEEYAPAKALRQRTSTTKMIVVEGFNP